MQPSAFETKPIPFIRNLCKGYSEKEILEAEERFRQYLRLVSRVCQRLAREKEAEEILTRQSIDKGSIDKVEFE